MEERESDHTDDPRQQGTGQGYPEENPAGDGTKDGPEAGTGGADDRAPDTHSGEVEWLAPETRRVVGELIGAPSPPPVPTPA